MARHNRLSPRGCATASSSSSLTSNSGERSSAASCRSSAGLLSTSPSAIMSSTPIWVVTARRSAPGVGTPARISARMISWNSTLRTCTRISTSSALTALPRGPNGRFRSIQALISRAILSATWRCALCVWISGGSVGQFVGSVSSASSLDRRPQRHGPTGIGTRGRMRDARRLFERPLPQVGALEHLVHGVQHVGQRAETVAQRHRRDLEMRGPGAEGVLPSGLDEHLRVGPLEREDRLLLVAHREQRARPVGGAVAEEEVVDQRPHHLPLQRVGVLPLVDEDMAEPGVELVAHPVALLLVAQQRLQASRSGRRNRAASEPASASRNAPRSPPPRRASPRCAPPARRSPASV
jgi:hypothetical protein